MPNPIIDIALIRAALQVISEFNQLDLKTVTLVDGGELLPVTDAMIDRFQITGLSNKDFVDFRFWEQCSADGVINHTERRRVTGSIRQQMDDAWEKARSEGRVVSVPAGSIPRISDDGERRGNVRDQE